MIKKEQIIIFKNSADLIYNSKDFTSATILYFKTLFAIQDYILLKKIGYSPKDHNERFRLLEKEFPEEYKILDMEFNTYRNTYFKTISKETCIRIKIFVENAISNYNIK
jgi:uncharacterized protein (UPF0332 family)